MEQDAYAANCYSFSYMSYRQHIQSFSDMVCDLRFIERPVLSLQQRFRLQDLSRSQLSQADSSIHSEIAHQPGVRHRRKT
jgi:hypothetical protein